MSDPTLSNLQKAKLSQLAKAAYMVAQRHFATDDLSSEDWRHREAIAAVGVRISLAHNSQYNALKRHFENLAGAAGPAFATAMREPTEKLRQLRFRLDQALRDAGLHPNYAESIARGPRFKAQGVEALDEDQLQQLLYTVVNRGRNKASIESNFAPDPERRRNKKQRHSRPQVEAPDERPARPLQPSCAAPAPRLPDGA